MKNTWLAATPLIFATLISLGLWSPAETAVFACCFGLASVSALSFSVGERTWSRLGIFVLSLAANAFFQVIVFSDEIAGLLPFAVALPTTLVLEAIKFRFGNFATMDSRESPFMEGLQFRIWHLMILTTVTALFCAVLRALWPMLAGIRIGVDSDTLYVVFVVGTILATNALISVWAFMGQMSYARVGVSMLVSVAGYYVGLSVSDFLRGIEFDWLCYVSVTWAASSFFLFLLRRDGVRFVRRTIG